MSKCKLEKHEIIPEIISILFTRYTEFPPGSVRLQIALNKLDSDELWSLYTVLKTLV